MTSMRTFTRWVGTSSKSERKLRLFRIVRWMEPVGNGGYSTMLSVALVPRWFRVWADGADWCITLLGVRLHWQRSWGGRHV